MCFRKTTGDRVMGKVVYHLCAKQHRTNEYWDGTVILATEVETKEDYGVIRNQVSKEFVTNAPIAILSMSIISKS